MHCSLNRWLFMFCCVRFSSGISYYKWCFILRIRTIHLNGAIWSCISGDNSSRERARERVVCNSMKHLSHSMSKSNVLREYLITSKTSRYLKYSDDVCRNRPHFTFYSLLFEMISIQGNWRQWFPFSRLVLEINQPSQNMRFSDSWHGLFQQ